MGLGGACQDTSIKARERMTSRLAPQPATSRWCWPLDTLVLDILAD